VVKAATQQPEKESLVDQITQQNPNVEWLLSRDLKAKKDAGQGFSGFVG
jgi:hypothetical protein